MARLEGALLVGMAMGAFIAGHPGVTNGATPNRPLRDAVAFSRPTFVDPPKVLLGDSGDSRCPATQPPQPCLKDVDDLLFGRTHLLRRDDFAIGYQGGRALFLTQDSTIPGGGTQTLNDGSGQYSPQTVVVGARPFEIASDVAVTFFIEQVPPPSPASAVLAWRVEGAGDSGILASGSTSLTPEGPQHNFQVRIPHIAGFSALAGDFTGDGLDEIVVVIGQGSSVEDPNQPQFFAVGTAVDPQDPSKGLRFAVSLFFAAPGFLPPLKIAKATLLGQPRLFTAQASTGFDFDNPTCGDLIGTGLGFSSYLVDPQTLAVISEGSFSANLPEGDQQCLRFVDMTSGRFSTSAHDQLLVTYGFVGGTVKVLPFDFEQGIAVPKAIHDTTLPSGGGGSFIRSGRFDWTSPLEQAALLVSNDFGAQGINTLRILSFDSSFNTTAGPAFQAGQTVRECAHDMVVGNFNRTQPNPTPPPATLANPNLQVAIPFTDCQRIIALRIFDVDPATSEISRPPNSELNIELPNSLFLSTLAAVDLQGRSLRVGVPDVVTIDKRQKASLILAAPPMHVDAVVPVSGGRLRPYNITGAPEGFRAGFTFSGTTNNKTDTTTGLTASFSAKESVEGKSTYGDCDLGDCASVDVNLSAQQALNSSTDTLTGNYSGSTQDVSATTGFSDLISFQSDHFTIFAYPVIGRRVCPSDKPSCSPSQQLTFNIAGPDTLSYKELQSGTDYSWYQPPWIPGNILSYPGNLDQLEAGLRDLTGFQLLSQADSWLTSQGGTANARASWTQGGTTGTTTNNVQNYSFDGSISVSGEVGLEALATDEVKVGLDLGGSRGISKLTDTSKTVSASQGIEFTRTAQFSSSDSANAYGYEVTPQIFGQEQPANPIDDNTTPADVQSYGALRTAHVVSVPTDSGGGEDFGSFWSSWYKSASDVALAQPLHWIITADTTDPKNGSCLLFQADSSNVDCAVLGVRLPSAPAKQIYESDFHHMRGLFVTGPSGGPQLTTATTGDPLLLQARVYNLSLAPLPTGSSLHVRFMAMPWDVGSNDPDTAGPSFQIGPDQVIPGDQLPAFNTDTPHPNWILVPPQAFDTGSVANPNACGGRSCDDLDLMFWVVVWIQNGNALVGEIQQHGLRSIPAAGDDFLDVAAREQTYSNNLGFYPQPFHIFPQATAPQAPTPPEGEIGAQLTQVGAAHHLLRRNQTTVLAAKLQTGGQALQGGLVVDFYDGDPALDGELIGSRYLPHLSANRTHDFRVPFRTHVCGKHDVFIVAGDDTRHEHTAKLRPILVGGEDCRAGGRPDRSGLAENVGSGSAIGRVRLEAEAASQGELDLRKATLTVRSVLAEGGGAGELLRGRDGAASLPQTLTARRDRRGSKVVFEGRNGTGPRFRVEVKERDRKEEIMELELEAEMGTIAAPQLCAANDGRTVLMTHLNLDDGVNPAHVFEWTVPWRCEGSRLVTP